MKKSRRNVLTEAATGGVLEEKVFLEISHLLQNTFGRVFLFLSELISSVDFHLANLFKLIQHTMTHHSTMQFRNDSSIGKHGECWQDIKLQLG